MTIDTTYGEQIFNAAVFTAQGDILNLTHTAGFIQINGIQHLGITQAYRQTLKSAVLKVSSGATDYNTAIRNALKPFTNKGIISITYDKDGKIRRRSIEAAVRQCVMQGVA